MQPTEKQKKFIWIAIAVIAVLYIGPRFLASYLRARAMQKAREAYIAAHQKPTPQVKPLPAGPPAPAVPVHNPDDAPDADPVAAAFFRSHLGQFAGVSIVPNRGMCKIGFQLKLDVEKPGYFTGYSILTCPGPAGPLGHRPGADRGKENFINSLSPTEAILEGHVVGHSLTFQVIQAIGQTPSGCQIYTYKATHFMDGVAVEWTEGTPEETCFTGQMVLARRAS